MFKRIKHEIHVMRLLVGKTQMKIVGLSEKDSSYTYFYPVIEGRLDAIMLLESQLKTIEKKLEFKGSLLYD